MMIRQLIKSLVNKVGIDIRRINSANNASSIGDMPILLNGLKKRGLKCASILDIGANQAVWSRMAKAIFPEADFYLVEPQQEMIPFLERFTTDFANSKFFLSGAGSEEGILVLTVWDDLAGSSFLPEADPTHLSAKQRSVPIITVDNLLKQGKIKMPDLVKLDIQGFELEALKGASSTFGSTEVYILEVSLFQFENSKAAPLFFDVVKFMNDRDYVVYDFPGFLHRPSDGALGQCDICFVKRNGFLRSSDKW